MNESYQDKRTIEFFKKHKKPLCFIGIFLLAILLLSVLDKKESIFFTKDTTNTTVETKANFPIPSIEPTIEKGKDFSTFSNEWISFKYPNNIGPLFINTDNAYTIYLTEPDARILPSVVIRVINNDKKLTPVEWLLSKESSYDGEAQYHTVKIDGQEAVSVIGGETVVNTPDTKYTIVIGDLPSYENGGIGRVLSNEKNTVIKSLVFKR